MPIKAVIFDVGGVLRRSETEEGRRKWEACQCYLPMASQARYIPAAIR